MSSRESSGIPRRKTCAAPRFARWGAFRRGVLAAAALTTAISASGPALAVDSAYSYVKYQDPAVIRVLGDGEAYTTVLASAPPITGDIFMHLDPGGSGHVLSWHVWASLWIEETDTKTQFPSIGQSASYGIGERPKLVEGEFPFSIPRSTYKDFALQACNDKAAHLRQNNGMTNKEIFAQDHQIDVKAVADHTYEFSGLAGVVLADPAIPLGPKFISPVTIICAQSASLVTPQTNVDIANLKVVGNDTAAVCSVSMVATIRTVAPNTEVSFRFEKGNGQKSEVHTVVTPGNALHQKAYTYRLSGTGVQTGQVRMVIEGEDTKSDWKDYEVNCVTNDFATLLPPEVVHLEVAATAKKGVYRGHVCPAEAKIIGVFKGRGSASGTAVLTVNNVMRVERAFNIDDKESKAVDYVQSLSWAGIDGPLQQDIDVGLVLQNANGEPVDVLTKTQTVSCVEADKPDQFVSNDPTPPVLSLSMRTGERRLYQGYICPERVVLRGRIRGQDDFNGRAVFVVKQEQSLAESQSQVKEFNFAVTENENLALDFEPEVRWSNVPQNGDAPPKQTMDLSFRVVKTGGTVASVERSLEVSCKAVTVANLAISFDPPKATGLAAVAKADEVFLQGHICPARISIGGVFKGQGIASGTAVLTANGVAKAEMPYSIEDGQTMSIAGEHDLNWANVQDPVQNNVSLALRLYNAEGVEVDSLTKGQTFECRKYTPGSQVDGAPDGMVSVLPPKPKKLIFVVNKEVQYRDLVCPAAVSVIGRVEGRGKASGTITMEAAGDEILEKPFSFEDDETQNFVGKYDLHWDVETATEQDMAFAMLVHNALGEQVGLMQELRTFECQSYRDGRRVVSGLSSGGAKSTQAQQGRTPAATGQFALQTGPAFAIQAPKGRVRQGQIQLSGGPANAKYDLRFYRKTEGGYRSLRSAQLPRQMTGRTATFNLKALSGGRDWRIEVCPAGSPASKGAKTACKTSDFRIARIGAAGKPAAPGTLGEAKVFILPGQGG